MQSKIGQNQQAVTGTCESEHGHKFLRIFLPEVSKIKNDRFVILHDTYMSKVTKVINNIEFLIRLLQNQTVPVHMDVHRFPGPA